MSKKYAVRNVRLCTKDCLCLYVCPTGATDTENSVIDAAKCTGCGDCAQACPSGAISMVPAEYPPQQPKTEAVENALKALLRSKSKQESIAAGLPGKLAAAIEKSNTSWRRILSAKQDICCRKVIIRRIFCSLC